MCVCNLKRKFKKFKWTSTFYHQDLTTIKIWPHLFFFCRSILKYIRDPISFYSYFLWYRSLKNTSHFRHNDKSLSHLVKTTVMFWCHLVRMRSLGSLSNPCFRTRYNVDLQLGYFHGLCLLPMENYSPSLQCLSIPSNCHSFGMK